MCHMTLTMKFFWISYKFKPEVFQCVTWPDVFCDFAQTWTWGCPICYMTLAFSSSPIIFYKIWLNEVIQNNFSRLWGLEVLLYFARLWPWVFLWFCSNFNLRLSNMTHDFEIKLLLYFAQIWPWMRFYKMLLVHYSCLDVLWYLARLWPWGSPVSNKNNNIFISFYVLLNPIRHWYWGFSLCGIIFAFEIFRIVTSLL